LGLAGGWVAQLPHRVCALRVLFMQRGNAHDTNWIRHPKHKQLFIILLCGDALPCDPTMVNPITPGYGACMPLSGPIGPAGARRRDQGRSGHERACPTTCLFLKVAAGHIDPPGCTATSITSFSNRSCDEHPMAWNVPAGTCNVGTVGACKVQGRLTISASKMKLLWIIKFVCCCDGSFVFTH